MNEYEKKCAFIIFDLGLNRAPLKYLIQCGNI